MRSFFFFALLLFLGACSVSPHVLLEATNASEFKAKNCYRITEILNQSSANRKSEKAFVIEWVPTTFAYEEIKYSQSALEKYRIAKDQYRLPISEAFVKLTLFPDGLSEYAGGPNDPRRLRFCLQEIPAEFIEISAEQWERMGEKIRLRKVKEIGKVQRRFVSEKPAELSGKEFYFAVGE